MTQLKDVLHLYPGCEVENYPYGKESNPVVGILMGVMGERVYIQNKDIKGNNWDHLTIDYVAEITPILNHLSDMPEEDKSELKLNLFQESNLDNPQEIMWTFEQTRILLSKGYDLFKLIESGQAIDRKTLKK